MIIGTVTGAFGARFFTDTLELGLPWGPILGSAVRSALRGHLRRCPRGRDDLLPRGPHRLGRGHQPGRDRACALPLARVLQRAVDAVRPGWPAPRRGSTSRCCPRYPAVSDRALPGCRPMVLVAAFMVVPVWYALNRLRWGLRLRSCGENPEATRSLGVRRAPSTATRACCSRARSPASRGAFLASRGDRELARGARRSGWGSSPSPR